MKLKRWNKRLVRWIAVLLAVFMGAAQPVYAGLDGDGAFQNSFWTIAFEDMIQKPIGVVQSVTATDQYIITIENTNDDADVPDVVSAYYRNPFDADGNPVQQYSLAMRKEEHHWEHGNGMTWNPKTGKIYVAFYTNTTGTHAGCIQEMDPNTLEPGELIQIGDGSYNILGIAYKEDTDQYVMQTDAAGGYSIKLLDNQFQIIDDFGPQDPAPGGNFQDMEVDGDYVMIYLMTYGMGIGEWLNVFSLSQRRVVLSTQINLADAETLQVSEAEGMVELEDGHFLSVVTVTEADGQRKVRFYETHVPYVTPTPEVTPTAVPEASTAASSDTASVPEADSEAMSEADLPPVIDTTNTPPDGANLPNLSELSQSIRQTMKPILTQAGTLWKSAVEHAKPLGHTLLAGGSDVVQTIRAFRMPRWGWLFLVGTSAVALGPGMYLYLLYVRRERRRVNARIRRRRRQTRRQMEAEEAILEAIETWKPIEAAPKRIEKS